MKPEEILNKAKAMENEIIENRRYLHKNAEVDFELDKTGAFIKEWLSELGCEYSDCGKNGVVCVLGDSSKGKTFMLRADMDALPVKECADVDFKCANGNMHACGHDMHTAMLLGAAKLLKSFENNLNGAVKLMFQPAEETLSGAKNMIENSVLKNPDVNGAMMLHVMAGLPLKTGTIIVSSEGVGAPAADYFTINIQGKGCHGSTPQQGIDALIVGAHILIGLQEINSRELGVSDEALITIGSFNGGTAGNVIADTADLKGTLRAYDDNIRDMIKKRITEISENIGKAYRAKVCVTFGSGCPTLYNDGELSESVEKYAKEIFGDEAVVNTETIGSRSSRSGGSEDFAYISKEVPSLMVAIAAGEPEKGYKYPQHHPKVTFDESVLYKGAALFSYCAVKWLQDN